METISLQNDPFELTKEFVEKLKENIAQNKESEIKTELSEMFPADLTAVLEELDGTQCHYLVRLLDTEISAEIINGVDYVVNLNREKVGGKPSTIIKLTNDSQVKVIRK